jgi:hypothetical protein
LKKNQELSNSKESSKMNAANFQYFSTAMEESNTMKWDVFIHGIDMEVQHNRGLN